jgi:hypothetical protein
MDSALRMVEGECDGVGTGCIVTYEYSTFDLQLCQDSVKFGGMLRYGESSGFRAFRSAVSVPIEGDSPPRAQ